MMFRPLSYEPLLLTDPGIFGLDVFLQFAAKGAGGRATFTRACRSKQSFVREFIR